MDTFKGAITDMLRNPGWLSTMGALLTTFLTQALGFLFSHYAARWGIDPAHAALIPGIADKITALVGLALVSFLAHEGLQGHGVDAAKIAAKDVGKKAAQDSWPAVLAHLGLPAGTPMPDFFGSVEDAPKASKGLDTVTIPAPGTQGPPGVPGPSDGVPGAT